MKKTNINNGKEGIYGGQKSVSGVILNCFPPYFLRQGLTEAETRQFS